MNENKIDLETFEKSVDFIKKYFKNNLDLQRDISLFEKILFRKKNVTDSSLRKKTVESKLVGKSARVISIDDPIKLD